MKKILVMMLAVLLLVVGFAGCTGTTEEPPLTPPEQYPDYFHVLTPPELPEEEYEEEEYEPEPIMPELTLEGLWLWRDGPLAYISEFDANGLGMRGFICDGIGDFAPDMEFFRWSTEDGSLIIEFPDGNVERWSYVLDGDVLDLTSEQFARMEYRYVRVITDVSGAELVGTWVWDEGSWFEYLFEVGGSGMRPGEDGYEAFEWVLTADGGLILDIDGGIVEMWCYAISDDVLTITSRQVVGMEFRYSRLR